MSSSNHSSPFQRRYPPELRERAVRMVHEAIAESGERVGAATRVARQLGIGPNRCGIGSSRPTSTTASARVRRPNSSDESRNWSVTTASCDGPMRWQIQAVSATDPVR
jgi:transposase-like protein